jgi:hypothetical protein
VKSRRGQGAVQLENNKYLVLQLLVDEKLYKVTQVSQRERHCWQLSKFCIEDTMHRGRRFQIYKGDT